MSGSWRIGFQHWGRSGEKRSSWGDSGRVGTFLSCSRAVLTPLDPDDDSWDNGVGWRIPGWGPPVRDLEFDCGGTQGILQDWYTLSSFLQIPEKFTIVSDMTRGKTD
jgi:hypothetical protein